MLVSNSGEQVNAHYAAHPERQITISPLDSAPQTVEALLAFPRADSPLSNAAV